jgi:hypothetical protein
MFGNTIQLLKDAANFKLLQRIGDAGDNGSRYYLREATMETTMNVRHSTYVDKSPTNRKGVVIDRHNVEIIQRVYGTVTTPDFVRKAYLVIENDKGDSLTGPQDIAGALQEFCTDANVLKLLGWES